MTQSTESGSGLLDEILLGLEERNIDIEKLSTIPAAGDALRFLVEGKIEKDKFWKILEGLQKFNSL